MKKDKLNNIKIFIEASNLIRIALNIIIMVTYHLFIGFIKNFC